MRLRRRDISPIRLSFWLALVALGVVVLLDRCPVELDAGDLEATGRAPSYTSRGEVLVVVSGARIASRAAEGDRDASWAWADLVHQEVGPVAVVDVPALTPEELQSHSVVIVTRSASSDPSLGERLGALRDFASNGGVLVLELPEGAIRTEFSADGAGGWRTPGAITAVSIEDPALAASLRTMPLLTRYVGSTRPVEAAETLLAMDGAPVIYARALGDGRVVTLEFELGAQVNALQQGLPGPGGEVRARTPGAPIRAFDLVASPRMIGADQPWADQLERFMVHGVLAAQEPMFAFWPYPDGGRGALLLSHESRRIDGRPLWQSIHERDTGARTATFVAAPGVEPGEGVLIADAEMAGHAALLWVLNAADANLYRSWGVLGLEPVRQPLTLAGQLEQLESWLGGEADVMGVRIWDGRWSQSYTGAFRAMDAVEFRYSASYGPAPGAPPGYTFGTCQPFVPLDRNGLPFRVREVPICVIEPREQEDVAVLQALLESAAANTTAVHVLTAADSFTTAPDMRGFDAWRDALRTAARLEMWVGGAGELVRFRRARGEAELRVISRAVTARDGDGRPRTIEFGVEAETSTRGLALIVPSMWNGMRLDRTTRGAAAGSYSGMADELTTEAVPWVYGEARLVILNPGFTTIGLRYTR